MPINPVQFAHSVCDEFLRYIFSEFPLSDPQMESQAKELLERSSSLDIPLVKVRMCRCPRRLPKATRSSRWPRAASCIR
jgi:hypothetical protein